MGNRHDDCDTSAFNLRFEFWNAIIQICCLFLGTQLFTFERYCDFELTTLNRSWEHKRGRTQGLVGHTTSNNLPKNWKLGRYTVTPVLQTNLRFKLSSECDISLYLLCCVHSISILHSSTVQVYNPTSYSIIYDLQAKKKLLCNYTIHHEIPHSTGIR